MRVITGIAKGRKLKAARGREVRPTSDRTKEALFNILGPRIMKAKFLDLYAGTGAIGIEAISRGAEKTVFIERNLRAVKIIRHNLESTGLQERAEVYCQEVGQAIELLSARDERFDLIYLDPPYLQNLVNRSLFQLNNSGLLASGGLIIAESSKLDELPEQAGQLKMFRQERYGDTVLSFYQET